MHTELEEPSHSVRRCSRPMRRLYSSSICPTLLLLLSERSQSGELLVSQTSAIDSSCRRSTRTIPSRICIHTEWCRGHDVKLHPHCHCQRSWALIAFMCWCAVKQSISQSIDWLRRIAVFPRSSIVDWIIGSSRYSVPRACDIMSCFRQTYTVGITTLRQRHKRRRFCHWRWSYCTGSACSECKIRLCGLFNSVDLLRRRILKFANFRHFFKIRKHSLST